RRGWSRGTSPRAGMRPGARWSPPGRSGSPTACDTRGCKMPVPGNGARAGSVPLDALDAEQAADLLAAAAALAGALAGQPEAEAACAELAADWQNLAELHIPLAIAAADLDEAIEEHTGILHPCPRPPRGA